MSDLTELRPMLVEALRALDIGVAIEPKSFVHEELRRLLADDAPKHSPLWHITEEHRAACHICTPKKVDSP
jgi:hypothetical protein